MLFEWQTSLYTGILEIDKNNRELFRRLNKLVQACNVGRGREEVVSILRFLEIYINGYLHIEEKYMTKYGYLDNDTHKSFHKVFQKSFIDVKRQFQEDGIHNTLTLKVIHMLINWIISHVNREDKELAAFFRQESSKTNTTP